MYMIEITEDKASDLSENIEKALKYIGKAMQCIDEAMSQSGGMGERNMGERGNYGLGGAYVTRASGGSSAGPGSGSYGNRGRYGSRWDEDDDDDDMGERRRRRR